MIMVDQQANTLDVFDVVIIGAGISGINAAYRLQEQSPDRSYTILEARGALGGTWDLFRYPGIRTDSDMYTFGFPFHPWVGGRTMAEGPAIISYMTEATTKYGIDKHIRYHHKVLTSNWSTDEQNWTLKVDADGSQKYIRASFVLFSTGYYDYNEALPAKIPGIENFQGKVVHPQFWPEDLDYENKNIVIIGSGATAITLLPNLAKKAGKVTMLQRSPSYIAAVPQASAVNSWPLSLLPSYWTYKILRVQFLILPFLFFNFCKTFPNAAKKFMKGRAAKLLPEGYPIDPNFDPSYGPWEQRLCASPNGDFYQCIREGKSEIVTAHIKRITEKSIILEDSDRTLDPDIIITATGLKVLMGGGAKISVDNEPIKISEKHIWKGSMLQDVPNSAFVIGYTNASWTLGADATAQFVTRLLNHMKANGYTQAVPKVDPNSGMQEQAVLNLKSTYIVRAKGDMPKAGNMAPWLPRTYYLRDLWESKFGSITHDIQYSRIST